MNYEATWRCWWQSIHQKHPAGDIFTNEASKINVKEEERNKPATAKSRGYRNQINVRK